MIDTKQAGFAQLRRHYRGVISASINGRKGSLTKLRKSRWLSEEEKDAIDEVIESVERLRIEFSNDADLKRYIEKQCI